MEISKSTIILGILAILVIMVVGIILSIYPDWLWFGNLNFSPVFWTMVLGKYGVATVIWLLMIISLAATLFAAQRIHSESEQKITEIAGMPISGRSLNTLILAAILIVSFVIASKGSVQWYMVLSYLNQQPFGSADPIFGKDIGFYVFSLPFYLFVREQLLIILLFAASFYPSVIFSSISSSRVKRSSSPGSSSLSTLSSSLHLFRSGPQFFSPELPWSRA